MSYMDHISSASVATSGCNGRPAMRTGEKSLARTPEELVAWAMLELAIEDTAILCRYGLITREGNLNNWPKVRRHDWRVGGKVYYEFMVIACMHGPRDHAHLREFWTDETQAQVWCDLCGCRLPAKDIWKSILENHAK
jgi:hypothetical protein